MKHWCWLLFGVTLAARVHAFTAEEERTERARIQAERAQAEAAFDARERECRQRFAVTGCIDDARRARRQTLEHLRQQQVLLDEAARKQRAAQRIDDIRAKVSAEDSKRGTVPSRAPREPKTAVLPPARGTSPESIAASSPPGASGRRSAQQESQSIQAYERRQQEAREHREAVERRNAARAAGGKPLAKPLPVPGPASGASSPG